MPFGWVCHAERANEAVASPDFGPEQNLTYAPDWE
jgi:hypothetical protein